MKIAYNFIYVNLVFIDENKLFISLSLCSSSLGAKFEQSFMHRCTCNLNVSIFMHFFQLAPSKKFQITEWRCWKCTSKNAALPAFILNNLLGDIDTSTFCRLSNQSVAWLIINWLAFTIKKLKQKKKHSPSLNLG